MKPAFTIFACFLLFSVYGQETWMLEISSNVELRTLKLTNKAEVNSKPLKGATIVLYDGQRAVKQVISDSRGNFSIGVPPEGDFTVTVSYPDCSAKKFLVSTKGVPADFDTEGWEPSFPIGGFIMAKPLYGIDYSALQQPVARVSFRQRGKVFDDDEDYTEQVLHKLKKIKSDEDELIARFLEAVQGGDAALKKPDCPLAKIWYEKALKLIPGEKYPIAQLSRVGDCMNEKARQDQLAAEKAARLREESEKQAVEMQQRQARERDEAEKVAREKEQAALAQEKAVSDAKERAEVEARARAEQEKREMEQAAQEKLAWAKAEEQAKQKAADDKLAREKAETAAREKAARERFLQERAKSEAEQKAAAEKLAREKEESAERERNAAGKLAREKAESEAKRQAAGEKSEKEKREEALRRKAAEEKISGEKKNIGQPEINHGNAPENKQISNEGASGDSETAGSEKPGSDPENPAAYDDRVKKSNAPIITVEKNDGERDQRGGWLRRKKSRHAVRHVIGTSQYEQTIAEADDLFQNKEYDKAKLLYGKALDLKPLDAHATSRLDQIKAIQSGPPE